MLIFELIVIFACLAAGGILKGATGAGAPVLAVPALAAVFDVGFAIAIMMAPNLLTNLLQMWQFRDSRPEPAFLWPLCGGAAVGAAVGTWLLTSLESETLLAGLGLIVYAYIALRLLRPHFALSPRMGRILALPAGLTGGILQGASGLSAPIAITFLNALKIARPVFIFTISLEFAVFTVVQIPPLYAADILTPDRMILSTFAVVPIMGAMPLGAALARRLPERTFDTIILVFLALIAAKLLFEAFV